MIEFDQLTNTKSVTTPTEVVSGTKQIALKINICFDNQVVEGLYRPETGILLTIDRRIPKPQELYRDVAYHRIDKFLGWNTSLPVIPWSLSEKDKGVIRPFFECASTFQDYQINEDLMGGESDFWTRVALLDYVCGLIDRTYNDFLIFRSGDIKSLDSGLSFVEGRDFSYQKSIIRELKKGDCVDNRHLIDLQKLDPTSLEALVGNLVDAAAIENVVERTREIIKAGRII